MTRGMRLDMTLKEELDEEVIINDAEDTLRLLRKQSREFFRLKKKLEELR
jgi:hypothetical protein